MSKKDLRVVTGAMAVAWRRKQKINQSAFWAALGVTQSGGSRYESGRRIPRPAQLLLLLTYGTEAEKREVLARLKSVK